MSRCTTTSINVKGKGCKQKQKRTAHDDGRGAAWLPSSRTLLRHGKAAPSTLATAATRIATTTKAKKEGIAAWMQDWPVACQKAHLQ